MYLFQGVYLAPPWLFVGTPTPAGPRNLSLSRRFSHNQARPSAETPDHPSCPRLAVAALKNDYKLGSVAQTHLLSLSPEAKVQDEGVGRVGSFQRFAGRIYPTSLPASDGCQQPALIIPWLVGRITPFSSSVFNALALSSWFPFFFLC